MQIQITGKSFELTEAIKKYINEKIGSLEHFNDKIMEVRVEIERCSSRHNKNNFRVLVNFDLPGQVVLRVEQTEDDVYTAIDCAREEMEAQLKKSKSKIVSKKRKAQKTRRLLKSVLFWRNKEENLLDTGEQEENE